MLRVGRHDKAPWCRSTQSFSAHQPRDAMSADTATLALQGLSDAKCSIALTTLVECRADLADEFFIVLGSFALGSCTEGMEATARDLEDTAHRIE
jgi:hypothetical protein